MKSTCLALLIVTCAAAVVSGAEFRTDINPALLYYQAYALAPALSTADQDYLFAGDWRGKKLPERFGELVSRYDNQFKLVRQAAQTKVPCDWGIDMSPGPATLLPGLARNKAIAQRALSRALWYLQQGRPADARDDLLATFALARNCSRDGTLVATLVQIAMEHLVCSFVAENFHRFPPEILKQLADGFEAAPARGTVAACIAAEQSFCHDWLLAKVRNLQNENPGNDAKVMVGIHEVIASFDNPGDAQTDPAKPKLWDRVNQASGGTSEGVVKLLDEMAPLYQRLAVIMALPQREYENQIGPFSTEIQNSVNPFVTEMFPALQKSRPKEFAVLVELAMVRAAVAYKLYGVAGFQSVADPCGQGPFAFQRFVFEGVDRGFQLTSAYAGREFPEVLIFVEKDGPPFKVYWKFAGQALTK